MLSLEVSKNHQRRKDSGFYSKYMRGRGLDFGYRGENIKDGVEPVLPSAKGLDLGDIGYDGKNIPYTSNYFDYLFSSHVLEHIPDYQYILREWHRVVKEGGHIIIMVPSSFLYDKSLKQFDIWWSCPTHVRLYTPASLLSEIESTLKPNSYRIVHMEVNDRGYEYSQALYDIPEYHNSCFEIELVLQKIKGPAWSINGWGETEAKSFKTPSYPVRLWRIFKAKLRRVKNKICK